MSIVVTDVKAQAVAIPSKVKIDQNAEIKGVFGARLTNSGPEDVRGTVTLEISDSDGHHSSNSNPILVSAGKPAKVSNELPLLVSYQKVGKKRVSASLKIDIGGKSYTGKDDGSIEVMPK